MEPASGTQALHSVFISCPSMKGTGVGNAGKAAEGRARIASFVVAPVAAAFFHWAPG